MSPRAQHWTVCNAIRKFTLWLTQSLFLNNCFKVNRTLPDSHDFGDFAVVPEGLFEIQDSKFEIEYLKIEIRNSIFKITNQENAFKSLFLFMENGLSFNII